MSKFFWCNKCGNQFVESINGATCNDCINKELADVFIKVRDYPSINQKLSDCLQLLRDLDAELDSNPIYNKDFLHHRIKTILKD